MRQQMFACPRCGWQNAAGLRFCGNCGAGLLGGGQEQAYGPQQMYSCPICHQPVVYGMGFCGNCRTPLNWPTQQVQSPPIHQQQQGTSHTQKEPRKKTNRLLIGCLSVVGAVLLVGGLICVASKDSRETTSTAPPSVPAMEVTSIKLYLDYKANEIAADAKYKGKILKVTGIVVDIGKFLGTSEITLLGEDTVGVSGVRCKFNKDNESQLLQLSKGQEITVQGKCTGFSVTYVTLENCLVTENKH